jgi:hypothetical protein
VEEDEDDDGMVEIVLDGNAAAEGEAEGDLEEDAKATCMICYDEDLPPEEVVGSSNNNSIITCPHSFCRTCIAAYLRTRVAEGRSTFPCPLFGESGCDLAYGETQLAELLDPELHQRHRRLQTLRSDPSLRECPNPACHALVPGGSKRRPRLEYPQCGSRFCWLHQQAHAPEQECAAFERAARRRERASASTVRRIAKRCPRCKAPTEKEVIVGGLWGFDGLDVALTFMV